jgi:hypothetical protein
MAGPQIEIVAAEYGYGERQQHGSEAAERGDDDDRDEVEGERDEMQ